MARVQKIVVILVISQLVSCLSVPVGVLRPRRGFGDNEIDSKEIKTNYQPRLVSNPESTPSSSTTTDNPDDISLPSDIMNDEDDDDDEDFDTMETSPSTGSNIFSLLNLANALFPSSGASNAMLRRMMRILVKQYLTGGLTFSPLAQRRIDTKKNEIDIDDVIEPLPLARQETDEENDSQEDSASETEELSDDNGGEEESLENGATDKESASNANSDDDSEEDSDEPPGGGDGEGGGILGILAGLSGGEDGQSDLGSLLATVGGIIANLSGDGVDINALIASGLGLFVGLLSGDGENAGQVLAGYLLTSLETLTGGGAQNNGNFFGLFLSKLIKGISAANPEDESNENAMVMTDSGAFVTSFLMGLLGEMSKGSSSGSSSHNSWRK